MIRVASSQDINRINEIGLLIKEDFEKVFNIEEELKKDYVQIYVYEEDANCNSLWLKECTDDKDLEKEVIYYTKGGIKFTVKSFKDGSFEDDYNG